MYIILIFPFEDIYVMTSYDNGNLFHGGLYALGIEPTKFVVETKDTSTIGSFNLSAYERANGEMTNQNNISYQGTQYPVMDITPHVSIKNTDNTSTGAVMKLSNARGDYAGVNNDTAGELRFLLKINSHTVILKLRQVM